MRDDPWNWDRRPGGWRVYFKGEPFLIEHRHGRWAAFFDGDLPTKSGSSLTGGRGDRGLWARRRRDLDPLIREYVEQLFRRRQEVAAQIAARDRQKDAALSRYQNLVDQISSMVPGE